MKNYKLLLLLSVALSFLCSCKDEVEDIIDSDDVIVDYRCYPIYFYISDSDGNDLLDKSFPDAIPLDSIVVSGSVGWAWLVCDTASYYPKSDYYDEHLFNYHLEHDDKQVSTRALAPWWMGLLLVKDNEGKYCLFCGEIKGGPKEKFNLSLKVMDITYGIRIEASPADKDYNYTVNVYVDDKLNPEGRNIHLIYDR